ncbi:Protein KRI1 homolog [Geodia barretti]|uniref:Protein KRI1 homolog n=1 Tax=Geodia barretti TaxID=519541 RepID=A0AA35SFB6_GEOBA|nr:Protein KRI1 homolog [Geodia barretti]
MDVAFEDGITINKAYAAKYEAKKRAEELSKLRDQYGDVPLEASESSSSEEEEDEDAEMLTADVEKDFLRTLSLIHSRDPRIYDNKTQFFRKDGKYSTLFGVNFSWGENNFTLNTKINLGIANQNSELRVESSCWFPADVCCTSLN